MACDAYCVTENILLVVFFFAIPFYIFLLCLLFKYRKTDFSTSFFKIFISLGVADIIEGVLVYFTQKATFWGWWINCFLSNQWFANVSLFVEWTAHFAQLNGIFLLTINRYVAVVHPTSYQVWFTNKNTMRTIGLQWAIALLFVTPPPFMDIGYKLQTDNKTLNFDIKTPELVGATYQFLTFLTLFDCLVVTILYSRMMYRVWRTRHEVESISGPGNSSTNSNGELRLAFIGLTVGVTLFFYSLYDDTTMVINAADMKSIYFLYSVVSDVF